VLPANLFITVRQKRTMYSDIIYSPGLCIEYIHICSIHRFYPVLQLLLDIVTNPRLTCDAIVNLPDREYKSQSISALRNRINYLVRLKKNDPSNFWALYSAANKNRDTVVEEESNHDEEPPSTPPARSHRRSQQRTPDTILSTPPPRPSSNSKNKNMSGSRKKDPTSSATSTTFAYNTMFESLKEAEDTGMLSLINLVLVHLFAF
jgi:hypothetical protein